MIMTIWMTFYDRPLNTAKADKPLFTIPDIAENQVWNCGTCGSGKTVKPLHFNSIFFTNH